MAKADWSRHSEEPIAKAIDSKRLLSVVAPDELPIRDIYPSIQFEAHLLKVCDFFESESFMQGHAFSIWQCNPRYGGMEAVLSDGL